MFEFLGRLLGLIDDPNVKRHDFDMEFPVEGSLDWVFTCKHCGYQVEEIRDALRLQTRRCTEVL